MAFTSPHKGREGRLCKANNVHSVTIIGIVRLVSVYRLFYDYDPTADPYYNIGITLNVVEVNVAIISASAPALRPLFRMWLPGLFGGSSLEYNRYGSRPTYGAGTGNGTKHSTLHHRDTTSHLGNAPGQQHHTNHSIALKAMRTGRNQHAECRSVSPSGSEEEIMTYNGIMRTTDVRVQYNADKSRSNDDHSRSSSDFKSAAETKTTVL